MPTYEKGEMFDSPGVHIVTASSFISNDGTLVMSMGAGLSLKTRYPDMPKVFDAIIKEYCGHQGRYGLILFGNRGILQRVRLQHQKAELEAKIRQAQEETKTLQSQSKALDGDKKAIEKVAREKYGMVREGEKVYKVNKGQ